MGAIAIVRISGPDAGTLAEKHFRSKESLRERYATYGEIVDERGARIDKGMVILSRAPHSYTGEDTLELQVHGSPIILREVMRALIASGAKVAEPGEFTKRAFLNGKLDLHSAESVADLIAAESRSAARAAAANLGGGLANEIRLLRAQLAHILEELAAAIDFPDEVPEPSREVLREQITAVVAALAKLRKDGEVGRIVREGVGVAIVGPPNAGKSSLLNALLGEERAIVSDIPGTTRDTIEETIAIGGVLVRLVDTAGIRAHADRVESAGIARTRHALTSARIVLLVLDGSQLLSPEANELLYETQHCERIVFANKADLGTAGVAAIDEEVPESLVSGSVFEATTLAALQDAIANLGWGGSLPDLERPHLASAREFEAVNETISFLVGACDILAREEPVDLIGSELQRAFITLGHITGDTATEELLDGIFSRFCIGK